MAMMLIVIVAAPFSEWPLAQASRPLPSLDHNGHCPHLRNTRYWQIGSNPNRHDCCCDSTGGHCHHWNCYHWYEGSSEADVDGDGDDWTMDSEMIVVMCCYSMVMLVVDGALAVDAPVDQRHMEYLQSSSGRDVHDTCTARTRWQH